MRLKELSIIQYQNVSPTPEVYRLWLSLHAFKKQLEYFAANDFQLLSIDDALDTMEGKKSLTSGRPISLTFDNGYQDFQDHVLPLLSQYGFPATLLISPLRVGTSREIKTQSVSYLSWSTLKELINNNVTIGAYEDDELNLNDLPEESVREHITTYKKMLEDQLVSLQVPGLDAVQEAGKLLEDLPKLWKRADLGERRKILTLMLEAVYVECKEEKRIVGIRPKPAFSEFGMSVIASGSCCSSLALRPSRLLLIQIFGS